MSPSSDTFAASARSAAGDSLAAALDRPIAELMQRGVLALQMDDTLAEAQHLLVTRGLSWAPVVDGGGAPLGVLSESDLLLFEAAGHDAQATRAWQVCTYRPLSVAPDTPARVVARTMVERRIHHMVVVSESEIVGVVSSMDFLRMIAAAA